MGMGFKFHMGMGMKMKSLKWEGNGTKNLFPHISNANGWRPPSANSELMGGWRSRPNAAGARSNRAGGCTASLI